MTNDIAIKFCDEYLARNIADIDKEFLKKAKEALQQQPCDDAISRQAALNSLIDNTSLEGYGLAEALDAIENKEKLPSVNPQEPKTGHWIEDAGTYYKAIHERGCEPDENTPIFLDDIACSECLAKFSVIDNETERFKRCPNCGAKMVEPQEGGDQE